MSCFLSFQNPKFGYLSMISRNPSVIKGLHLHRTRVDAVDGWLLAASMRALASDYINYTNIIKPSGSNTVISSKVDIEE